MNPKINLLFLVVVWSLSTTVFAQSPGGVSAGMKAWYKSEAGTTASAGGTLNTWTNQAANPNLINLLPIGGATTVVTNNPVPFNFHTFMQHNAGAMYQAVSVTNTDILTTTAGSVMGVGTAPDQLISITGNATSSPFDANRANSGTRGAKTEFGNKTTNTGAANFATGTVLNTGNANIFGLRAGVGATPAHENTFNGLKATGVAVARPAGSYRFAIGSYPGFFYGTNKSAEVVCHNRQLTANEFSRVESYFGLKYGITLGNTTTPVDYLSSNSTVIWTGDAVFQNNITGIGRDDSSGLVQKQSKAVTAQSKIYIYNENNGGVFPAMNVDNVTTFTADQSFTMFGDNNGDTLLNICAMNGKVVRIGRIWKMLKTGTVGDVTLAFNASALPAGLTQLLVSTDNTFPEASTTIIPLTVSGLLKYAAMPAGNLFFTFSADPLDITIDAVNITCASTVGGTLTASTTGGLTPLSFSWNTTPPQNTSAITNVPAGNYTVTVTQSGGCTYTQNATITNEFITLTANLNTTDVKCFGDDNGIINVNNTNGTPAYSYALNNQINWVASNQFQNLSKGFYTVYLKDANGCTGKDTITIVEPSVLSLSLQHTDDYCEISKEPNGNLDILLSGGTLPYNVKLNGTPVAPSLKLSGLTEGHYTYAVTDKNGCKIEDTFSIEHVPCCLVFVPNSFTPNNDGNNDIFKVESAGRIKVDKMIIYNRYGQVIFSAFDKTKGWDGTKNGAPADVGVYFYNIKYTCESFHGPKSTELKGDITLIR